MIIQHPAHVIFRLVLLGMSIFLCAAVAAAQPRMQIIGGDTIDWGRVAPNMLKRDVKIVNAGSDTLHIRLEPSCGCTVAPLDKTALAAGDTATAKISIDMTNRAGDQLKQVKVLSNDPAGETTAIILKAHIVIDLAVEPPSFGMKTGAKLNEEYTAAVMLKNISEGPFMITPPENVSNDSVIIRFVPAEPRQLLPGETLALTAYITPRTKGIITNPVMLHTSGPYTAQRQLLLICSVPMMEEIEGN